MEMDSSAGGVAVVAMDAIGVCVCVLCHSSTTTVALLIITIPAGIPGIPGIPGIATR